MDFQEQELNQNGKMKRILLLAVGALLFAACGEKSDEANLPSCHVTLSGIRFTRALNGADKFVKEYNDIITFTAQPGTDYFRDPDGTVLNNAPILLTEVDNTRPFTFQSLLTPGFTEKGTYNAAALYVFSSPMLWQKFAFEQDERGVHRVVSVRTIDTSDDNNHQALEGTTSVWYKISSDAKVIGFYYSLDGELWQLVRLYRNNYPDKVYLGISSQAPREDVCASTFESLSLTTGTVGDFRLGD